MKIDSNKNITIEDFLQYAMKTPYYFNIKSIAISYSNQLHLTTKINQDNILTNPTYFDGFKQLALQSYQKEHFEQIYKELLASNKETTKQEEFEKE